MADYLPIDADYGMIWIGAGDPSGSDFDLPIGGLLWTATTHVGVWMLTGTHMGAVAVSANLSSDPPPIDRDDWEDISSAIIDPRGEPIQVLPLLEGEPIILTEGNLESYVVRCASRGRDAALGYPSEQYLIDIWPAKGAQRAGADKITSMKASENLLLIGTGIVAEGPHQPHH